LFICLNNFEEGKLNCEKSIKIYNKFPNVYVSLAMCLNYFEKHDDAIKACEVAASIDKNYYDAYYEIAYIYRTLKNDSQTALKYYNIAIDVSSNNFLVFFLINNKVTHSLRGRSEIFSSNGISFIKNRENKRSTG
jgi:tetratricopeptide (TPR) repeat protein